MEGLWLATMALRCSLSQDRQLSRRERRRTQARLLRRRKPSSLRVSLACRSIHLRGPSSHQAEVGASSDCSIRTRKRVSARCAERSWSARSKLAHARSLPQAVHSPVSGGE